MNKIMRRAVLRFSIYNRTRKARLITEAMHDGVDTVIFVGCSPGLNPNEGLIEKAVAARSRVLAACDILLSPVTWPFLLADGRRLPFRDGSTDMILANAVIEHVGDEADQRRFVAEQSRVARMWVITTPNRWFPVESHTSVILRHWSPRWRERRSEFTRLLSYAEFRALLPAGATILGRPWSPTFTAIYRPAGEPVRTETSAGTAVPQPVPQ